METIKVKYFSEDVAPLEYVDGKSDWIDLRAAQEVTLRAGEFRLIPLGVAMELPAGRVAPRVVEPPPSRLTASTQPSSFRRMATWVRVAPML